VKTVLLVICAFLGLTGCAVAPSDTATINAWARLHGGEITDSRLDRVRIIGTALLAAQSAVLPLPAAVRFHVLHNTTVTAYSWPTGDIYLSAGLVDATTDDEIAAAIAHELGHLIKDVGGRQAAGLRGTEAPLTIEEQADGTGVAVLKASGRPGAALGHLLEKVCAASGSAECRQEMRARIQRLEQPEKRGRSLSP
jgi:hypothetical protein